ncbi:thioesterase family protein [Croceicoccus sp. YJ47]|uniref:acyl-CoA thioesterase n=1 Tax=Croceicoccus sp. YJ47 TaxID=2798724 RepID=UPI001F359956|nr:acyl-CoA thioesterase [Croceicoccus sp. YJ47]
MSRFTMRFTARAEHIDIMGHVNNAVWLQWVQDIAGAHWHEIATAEENAAAIWLVTRHEIDYRGNIAQGESVIAETWVPDRPAGARFDRMVAFRREADDDGAPGLARPIVSARSTWAMLDRETRRPMRVPATLADRVLTAD